MLIIVDNVYKGLSLIVCATIVTLTLIVTFRPYTAGFHQLIVSIYWIGLFLPPWLFMIGVSQTLLMVGGFRSKALLVLWEEETDPSAVGCGRDRLSCCLIVGIQSCFRNLSSTVPIDVVRVKSYVNSLFNSTRVCSRNIAINIKVTIVTRAIKLNPLYKTSQHSES